MIEQGKRLAAQTAFYGHRVDFYLIDHDRAGGTLVPSKIEWEPWPLGSQLPPSFSLELDIAQELFEQLWAQGFRPKHDHPDSKALDEARREHIGDLRKAAKLT